VGKTPARATNNHVGGANPDTRRRKHSVLTVSMPGDTTASKEANIRYRRARAGPREGLRWTKGHNKYLIYMNRSDRETSHVKPGFSKGIWYRGKKFAAAPP